MAERTVRKTFRFRPVTLAVIRAIGEAREGLTDTKVVENALDLYGRKVLGRHMADLVAPRARPGRRSPRREIVIPEREE